MGEKLIKGIKYESFSMESSRCGGIAKKDAIALLKNAGIKVSTADAYTPYVGHYALWVESSRADQASTLLFG